MKDLILTDFPEGVIAENLRVIGYAQGNKIDRLKQLTVWHFDTIHLLHQSRNVLDKKPYIHALGYKNDSKRVTFLILEEWEQ